MTQLVQPHPEESAQEEPADVRLRQHQAREERRRHREPGELHLRPRRGQCAVRANWAAADRTTGTGGSSTPRRREEGSRAWGLPSPAGTHACTRPAVRTIRSRDAGSATTRAAGGIRGRRGHGAGASLHGSVSGCDARRGPPTGPSRYCQRRERVVRKKPRSRAASTRRSPGRKVALTRSVRTLSSQATSTLTSCTPGSTSMPPRRCPHAGAAPPGPRRPCPASCPAAASCPPRAAGGPA